MKKRVVLLLPLALLVFVRPLPAESGNSLAVLGKSAWGVYTVVKDASAPHGAKVVAAVPALVDAELRCRRDGWRTKTLAGESASGQPTYRANVDRLSAKRAAEACEAGRAIVAIPTNPVGGVCKNVNNAIDIMGVDLVQSSPVPGVAVQVKCQGFAKEQVRYPLWLMWNPATQDNDSVPGYWPRAAPWGFVRIQGEVLKEPLPGTLPLKHYRRTDGTGDTLTTTKAPPPDYKDTGVTGGHIFAPGNQPPGTVALVRHWSSARKDYYLNEDPKFDAAASGYGNPVLEGYIYPSH